MCDCKEYQHSMISQYEKHIKYNKAVINNEKVF